MERTAAERRARVARALTAEEAAFSAAHLGIVRWYLSYRGLDPNEWYDAVILRYLDTVKRWFEEPELRTYSFATIATRAIQSALWNERQKRGRRPETVSLFAPLPGTDGMTLIDIIPAPEESDLAAWY